MQIGRRVAKLRAAHGESLRDAAVRTGVSHTTIARIEKGEVTGSFHSTLLKIAEGYGVRTEFLLTGRDPRQDFEQAIRRLPPEERSQLYFASVRTRVKMVLDFLMAEYTNEFEFDQLTQSVGLEGLTFRELLEKWQADQLTDDVNHKLAEALSRLTGISQHWFRWGVTGGSDGVEILPREMLTAYVNLIKKAAQAGVQPQMLDMAIDLLIMKNKETAAAVDRS
jgi:transcriptional regulator with XRE-family HTH domain